MKSDRIRPELNFVFSIPGLRWARYAKDSNVSNLNMVPWAMPLYFTNGNWVQALSRHPNKATVQKNQTWNTFKLIPEKLQQPAETVLTQNSILSKPSGQSSQ